MIVKYDPDPFNRDPFNARDEGGGSGVANTRPFKHIILGIDGTWQAAYSDIFHSNVYRLNVALNYRDSSREQNFQVFIYSSGLGTANKSSRLAAGAFGEGLDESILQAYINLVSNYVPGDKIYLFGFSRGAVAVRALTGFITHSGLLKANFSSLIEHAWRYFTGAEATIDYASQRGSITHPNVRIEFLGVWDTVTGPYGRDEILKRYRFSNLKLDPSVNHGVQILSIDESRKDFSPLLWSGARSDQTLEQIWIPGVHGDIGGGYNDAFLSTVSLMTMIDKLAQYCPSLSFDEKYIEGSLLPIIERENIVVNDEWKDYLPGKLLGQNECQRSVKDMQVSSQSGHPLTKLMQLRTVLLKGRITPYQPSYQISDGGALTDIVFNNEGWYNRKLKNLLTARFDVAGAQ